MLLRFLNLSITEDETVEGTYLDESGAEHTAYVDLVRSEDMRNAVKTMFTATTTAVLLAPVDNCGQCVGACCTSKAFSFVQVREEDVRAIAKAKGLPFEVAERDYFQPVNTITDEPYFIRFKAESRAPGGSCCTFLNVDKQGVGRCSVYDARPRRCREYPAQDCQVFIPIDKLMRHREWYKD